MPDGLWIAGGFVSAVLGMAWLALAMEVHWRDVHATPSQPAPDAPSLTTRALRGLGALALVASLLLCLQADVATMAVLVWMIALALSALVVAFTLSWRPRVLRLVWPRQLR